MSNNDDSGPVLEGSDQASDRLLRLWVKSTGWLVEHDQLCASGKHPSNPYPLRLPARHGPSTCADDGLDPVWHFIHKGCKAYLSKCRDNCLIVDMAEELDILSDGPRQDRN